MAAELDGEDDMVDDSAGLSLAEDIVKKEDKVQERL